MSNKTLVAYFSASGVTSAAAKALAAALGADIYQIAPAVPYTAADLNWMDKHSRSTLEMNDPASRPEISGSVDISQYDTILLGFPVWWYIEPRIVDTFLDTHDLTGKTLIPFATSGGSGIEKAEANLKQHYPAANWRKGKLVTPQSAAAWARGLNI